MVCALRMATAEYLQLDYKTAMECPDGQPFFLKLFHAIASLAEDVDAGFLQDLLQPLPLGVDEQLPRTPGVFRCKSPTETTFAPPTDFQPAHNYPSADKHEQELLSNFQNDVNNGLMAGPFSTLKAAADFIGCREDQ
eukprot:6468418-Amphidinium_carterae.1